MSAVAVFPEQVFGAASTLVAALIGGGFSFWASHSVLSRSLRQRREEEVTAQKVERASRALSAFFKLLDTANCTSNYKREIDEMFLAAHEKGAEDLEVWGKITPIVGAVQKIEPVAVEELSFLLECKKSQLIDRVRLNQSRVANIVANMELYGRLRGEFFEAIQPHATQLHSPDVLQAAVEVSGSEGAFLSFREAQLNNLIGQIITYLEKDEPEARSVLIDFKEAASGFFGDSFPDFGVEFKT